MIQNFGYIKKYKKNNSADAVTASVPFICQIQPDFETVPCQKRIATLFSILFFPIRINYMFCFCLKHFLTPSFSLIVKSMFS